MCVSLQLEEHHLPSVAGGQGQDTNASESGQRRPCPAAVSSHLQVQPTLPSTCSHLLSPASHGPKPCSQLVTQNRQQW